jgi:hypothetical protein
MWQGMTWDYCRFICDAVFMQSSFKFAVNPAPYNASKAYHLRMVQWSWSKGVAQVCAGSLEKTHENFLCYSINTTIGNSGSPVFDMNGRLIALHKKGSPNEGLIFSPNGFMEPWFLTQTGSKKFQSPCTQL